MDKKLAIPILNNDFCSHFGESEAFLLVEISDSKVVGEEYVESPPHKPGAFPLCLKNKGVTHVVAGGVGKRALHLFNSYGIESVAGVGNQSIRELIEHFIQGALEENINECHHELC
ncbi:MAG TPA: hypothetical protein DDY13_08420 [Cytophagales bacterium]|jgi:predicted Fe-Mo cluster-binding NifX family protein|nr:hypothetical protein [Cytophagales bacterium]